MAKPATPLSESEVEYWLRQFAEEPTSGAEADRAKEAGNESQMNESELFDNPFPPGYGEDLLEE